MSPIQSNIGGIKMKTMTDSELKYTCYGILLEKVGDVDAERFIALVNRDAFDYTQWRKQNLGVGETVDSLYEKIRDFSVANQAVERASV